MHLKMTSSCLAESLTGGEHLVAWTLDYSRQNPGSPSGPNEEV